jgi:hypothetical protein
MNGWHLKVLKLKMFVIFEMCCREGSIFLSPTHNLLSDKGKKKKIKFRMFIRSVFSSTYEVINMTDGTGEFHAGCVIYNLLLKISQFSFNLLTIQKVKTLWTSEIFTITLF